MTLPLIAYQVHEAGVGAPARAGTIERNAARSP